MNHDRRWLLSLALTVALAGCNQPAGNGDDTPAATADPGTQAMADAPEVDDTPAPATNDAAEHGFELTMDKVDAYFATLGNMAQMAKDDPSLASDEEDDRISMDASESVDAYIARLEADPVARRLVTSAGMSVADFAYTNSAMIEGMMIAGMMEATGSQTIPEGINPEYVRFAREHKDELAAKAAGLEAKYGAEN